ncbi:unnamed protein product [Sphagnum troendelagicum]|uniref:Uncharacterized protein n=1 Tax=Sphagnum troendelagicum TaxID=128251 RepID=A0ABP0USJ3_9BRYO
MERARASSVHRTPRNMMKKVTMEAFSSVCVTRSKRVTTTPITTEKEKTAKGVCRIRARYTAPNENTIFRHASEAE